MRWLDLDGGFGAYLVLEADAGLGITLAGELFAPVEEAITAARSDEMGCSRQAQPPFQG